MSDQRTFDEKSTTDDVLSGLDLSGRRIFITGASSGLGTESARALASAGAAVTLAGRDRASTDGAAEEIRSTTGNPEVDSIHLDLISLESVRDCAQSYIASDRGLDLLINNAGVMGCPLERTHSGWEMQLATNHIGHFLLTGLLVPALRSRPSARIINLSSAGHRFGGMDFEDPHFERREYDKWTAYGQSKTANILFTLELDRRLAASGIRSLAVHPGMIATALGRHLLPGDIEDLMSRGGPNESPPSFKTVEQGAATGLWAATAPELQDVGGVYCEDCRIAEAAGQENSRGGYAAHAMDRVAALRLWTLSEEWVGEEFPLA